jgi:hypothetical protein
MDYIANSRPSMGFRVGGVPLFFCLLPTKNSRGNEDGREVAAVRKYPESF